MSATSPHPAGQIDERRARAILERVATIPCVRSLGLASRILAPGHCVLMAPRDPAFHGIFPLFHGGMLAMVADCAAWFAIVTETGPDEPLLTTDLHIRYLRPCASGAVIDARVIKLGKTLCPVEVRLSDEAGELVALAQVTYMRLEKPLT